MTKEALALPHASSILDSIVLSAKSIFDAGREKDAVALAVLDRYFDYMGRFLATLCCVADPEVVVLGGCVSKAGQPLLDGVSKAVEKYAFGPCKNTKLAIASLGNDAGIYGALKLALQNFA